MRPTDIHSIRRSRRSRIEGQNRRLSNNYQVNDNIDWLYDNLSESKLSSESMQVKGVGVPEHTIKNCLDSIYTRYIRGNMLRFALVSLVLIFFCYLLSHFATASSLLLILPRSLEKGINIMLKENNISRSEGIPTAT